MTRGWERWLPFSLGRSRLLDLSLQLDPAIHEHVSTRKALSHQVLPQLARRVTSLVPEALECSTIGIKHTLFVRAGLARSGKAPART